jgi:hypothetical protein
MSSSGDARVRSVRSQQGRRQPAETGALGAPTGQVNSPNPPNSSQVDAMIARPGRGVRNLTRLPAPNSGANSLPPSSDEAVVEPMSQVQAGRGLRGGTQGSAADVEGSGSKPGWSELHDAPRQALSVADSGGRRTGRKWRPATDEHSLMVRVPAELPSLTAPVSRILLAILVELTTVDVIEVSPQGGRNDR